MTLDQRIELLKLLNDFMLWEAQAQGGEVLPFAVSDVGWISSMVQQIRNLLLADHPG